MADCIIFFAKFLFKCIFLFDRTNLFETIPERKYKTIKKAINKFQLYLWFIIYIEL